ncbi:hypothetical protein TWF730_003318 [Orbilia blumenaviensis]|uniref:Uncharacterized protein n=1 Tax=Orbilia blumenaviensis TaxID=1796055 RepID=A0AAV9U9D2_9PEZI
MQTGEPVARFSRPGRTSSEEATESPGQLDIYDCAPALLASATTLLVAQHDQNPSPQPGTAAFKCMSLGWLNT